MDQLKRLRKEKGLSQAKLAALADIDPSTVNQIERGVREASPATLRKLAQALDVSLAELLEDTAPKGQSRSSREPSFNDVLAEEERRHPRIEARLLFLEGDLEKWREELETGMVRVEGGDAALDTAESREAWELAVFSEKLRHVTELAELGILEEILEALGENPDPASAFCREFLEAASFRAPEERAIVSGLMQDLASKVRGTETAADTEDTGGAVIDLMAQRVERRAG